MTKNPPASTPSVSTYLPISYHLLRPDAKPPICDDFRLGFFAYMISDTGRAIQAIVPPRTSRLIDTQVWLEFSADRFLLCLFGLFSQSTQQPPLFVPFTPIVRSCHIQIPLYNGGHESVYIRHEDPIAQGLLLPLTAISLVPTP